MSGSDFHPEVFLAGRWEVGEDAGLNALAVAVEREVCERATRLQGAEARVRRKWSVQQRSVVHSGAEHLGVGSNLQDG